MDTQQNNTTTPKPAQAPVFKASQNTELYDAITKEEEKK